MCASRRSARAALRALAAWRSSSSIEFIFVEIELLEHFRQLSVTEGPVTVSVGKANAKGKAGGVLVS